MTEQPPRSNGVLPDERSEFVQGDGLRLLCRQWGRADAEPVLFLHGLRGFSGTWRQVAAALSADYRIIAYDQRGRGESDWDPLCNYYTDAYLADLEAVIDRLALRRFALVGHSMGGTTAYIYADRHPERVDALVIEDIAPGSSTVGVGAERIIAEMAALPMSFATWTEARNYWRARRPAVSVEALEQRLAESLRSAPDGRVVWRYDAEGIRKTRLNPDASRVVDLWPVVDRLRIPTLIIRGELSDFCPAETVAQITRRNPLISSVTVPAASHYVHDEQPAAFIEHLQRFLASHPRARAALTAARWQTPGGRLDGT